MDRQLAVWESSIQASLDRFHVAFQELSTDILNSDFLKGLIDAGTTIIRIIDEIVKHIGVLGTALVGLGISKTITTMVRGAKMATGLSTAFSTFFTEFKTGGDLITATTLLLEEMGVAAGGAATALGGMLTSFLTFFTNPVTLVGGAVAALGVGIYKYKKKQEEELYKQASQTTESWNNSQDQLESYKEKYTQLNEQLNRANISESERIAIKQQLLNLQNEITANYGDQVGTIDLINGKLETQLGILSNISQKEAERNIQDNYSAYQQSATQMNKKRTYKVKGNYNVDSGEYLSSNLAKSFNKIYEESGFTSSGTGFKFKGDATEFDAAVRQVISGLNELKDQATGIDSQIIQDAIDSAQEALEKNNEVIKKYSDNYKSYLEQSLYAEGFGDELAEYAKRVQEYNDAIYSGDMDRINNARSQLEEYQATVDSIKTSHSEYGDFFDEVADSVDHTTEAVVQFKDLINNGIDESVNQLGEYEKKIKQTVDNVKALGLDGVDVQDILLNGGYGFADLYNLAKAFKPDFDFSDNDAIKEFADLLAELGLVASGTGDEVDLASADFNDFMISVSKAIDRVDEVNSALVNSFASGGLSARINEETGALEGDVAKIINAYKGADVSELFERTAKGIIVNRDALRELQAEQEKATKEEFTKRIAEAYHNYREAFDAGDYDAEKYWKEQYDAVRLLAGAYDGATSAYQKWLDAQKMGEAGDMYDTVAKTALDRGKELYDAGLVGTNEFRAIAQLYSNLDLSTASVDEVTEAYEKGYNTVKKYFTEGQEGAVAFADKIVELGYATKDAQGNYDFFEGIDTQALADDLGISVDLVEAAFNKLGDYGFDIHFSFDDAHDAVTQFENRLQALNNEQVETGVTVDIYNDEQLREIAEYLLNLDDADIKAQFDLEGCETVDEVIEKLSQNYNVKATVSTDTTGMPADMNATAHVGLDVDQSGIQLADQTVHVEPEPSVLEVQTVAKLDTTEVDNYKPDDKTEANVVYGVDKTKPDNYQPDDKNADVNYHVYVDGSYKVDNLPSTQDRYITYHINTVGSAPMYKGTVSNSAFQGMSHARGTAHANGIALKRDENALINELGAEIVVRPSEDSWMIFNDGKPTMGAPLKRGDIIFNAKQTKELLSKGWTDDFAKLIGNSYAGGTIKGSAHATVKGGGNFKKATTTTKKKNNNSSGGGGNGNGKSSNKEAKDFKETLDEIEIKIDRIERSISNLDTIASNTFESLSSRGSAISRELTNVTKEIDIQHKAYARYMKQASKVGLSETWAKKVREGTINIEDVKDENLWKKIEEYKKWVDKAYSARDSIYQLTVDQADIWNQKFELVQTNYENAIAQYQHVYDMMDSYIELAENEGKITANKYRQKQIAMENAEIKKLTSEYDALKNKMTDALASGTIKINSEGYYEMLNALNEISQSIAESNANIAELNKSIRETNWEIFDKGADSISAMNDELEFLYGLLGDEDDMFDDKGHINKNGIAGFGILSSQYNVSMQEAQRYAAEIEKLDKEIANDQYNQDLIERRQELYESWRKSIEGAEDYKQAIVDLTETGIKKQIDSLKELISDYNDLIDTQKDEIDYAKKVSDAQANINRLQKQLNAYANDDSEEGATRRQRLQAELKTAKENLSQTQEERQIAQTKKLLSDLQDEYEDILNARLDDVDALIQSVINGVDANANTVATAINQAANDVGYSLTADLNTLFTSATRDGNDLVSYFTNGNFVEKVTGVAKAVENIEQYYTDAKNVANKEASSNIADTTSKTSKTTKDAQTAAAKGTKALNTANKVNGVDGNWIKNSKGTRIAWKFSDGTKATGWSRIDGKWYLFDENGNMKSGLQTVNKAQYYVRRNSGRAQSEWVEINKKWYYFGKDGKAVSGWQNLAKDGKKGWFYFDPSTNVMKKNAWIKNSSKKGTYYVGSDGRMLINGKFKTKDGYRTFDKNGKWKGYKLGTRSVSAEGLYWTNEGAPETIIRKSDGAVLTKLNAGDTVMDGKATQNMWDFANDPQKFLKGMGINNNSTVGDVSMVFNLSGLRNPSEFMDALRKDKRFEKFIQEITLGRVLGHGSLTKNAIAF